MIMDGSCLVQIFLSRKLNALALTIHADIHTDTNTIHPSPSHTHHGLPRPVEMPAEKVYSSFTTIQEHIPLKAK